MIFNQSSSSGSKHPFVFLTGTGPWRQTLGTLECAEKLYMIPAPRCCKRHM